MCSLVVILCTASNVHSLTGACSGLTSDNTMCRTWASPSSTEEARSSTPECWLAVLEQELSCATFVRQQAVPALRLIVPCTCGRTKLW